jgi:tetratricopeptide (TPR) repeat protein
MFVPYGKEEQFNDTVLLLISKGWLEADKNRFRVPSYIRMVLHKKFKPSPNKLKRYLNLLHAKLEKRNVESLQWLVFAQAYVKSMTQITPEVADLAIEIAQLCDAIGARRQADDYYQLAVYVYEEVVSQMPQPDLIELITKIWIRLGEFDRALFYAHQLLDHVEQQGETSQELADTYQLLAQLYAQVEDFEKAIYYADSALDIYTMLFDPDDERLKQMQQFHEELSKLFKQQTQRQDKKQWFRRLFI